MKIIHCADIHLGSKMETHFSREKAAERKEEIFETFVNMIMYAEKNSIDKIIIAGDLIDNKNVNNTIIKKLIQVIEKHNKVDFYYLEGNHDAHVLDKIEIPNNLHIFKEGFSKFDLGSVSIGGMTNYNINDIAFDEEKFNILVLHGNVVKYKSSNIDDIYLPDFNGLNINYFALGHIHKNEIIEVNENSTAVYSGCLEGRGFDELGKKGFYVLDINEDEVSLKFEEISKRVLEEVYIDITSVSDNDELYIKIEEVLKDYSKDNLYKVILTGSYDLQLNKKLDKISKDLNEKYYYIKVVDQSKLRIDYKDYENDISLIGEFVRTVTADTNLSIDDRSKILEYGIKALKNEDL